MGAEHDRPEVRPNGGNIRITAWAINFTCCRCDPSSAVPRLPTLTYPVRSLDLTDGGLIPSLPHYAEHGAPLCVQLRGQVPLLTYPEQRDSLLRLALRVREPTVRPASMLPVHQAGMSSVPWHNLSVAGSGDR